MTRTTVIIKIAFEKLYASLDFSTIKILAPTFNKCGIYFANLLFQERFLQCYKLISIDVSYTAAQKHKLCYTFSFDFTAYSIIYFLQNTAENYKSYGQVPK